MELKREEKSGKFYKKDSIRNLIDIIEQEISEIKKTVQMLSNHISELKRDIDWVKWFIKILLVTVVSTFFGLIVNLIQILLKK